MDYYMDYYKQNLNIFKKNIMYKSKLIKVDKITLNKLRVIAAKAKMSVNEYIRYILDEVVKDS